MKVKKLRFLSPGTDKRKNMSELTPGTYTVGIPVIQPLTRGAKGNPSIFLIFCEHQSSTDFPSAVSSGINAIGNPCRDILKSYADIDLLSAFFVPVSNQLLPVGDVPVSQIVCKCVQVCCGHLSVDYVVKIPNNYEHH